MSRSHGAGTTVERHSTESLAPIRSVRPITLLLLGGFDAQVAGRSIPLRAAEQRLIALVALLGRPASRLSVAGTLWPEVTDEHALGSLRSTLWRLRQRGVDAIQVAGDSLRLRSHVSVDLWACVGSADRLLTSNGVPAAAKIEVYDGEEALRSAGELLPHWSDDWVTVERERFRQLRLHALERACLHLARLGQYGRAVDIGLAAVSAEPLRESAHRALIEVHAAEGNVGEAIRQFHSYERLMREELGLGSSPDMRDLIAGILASRTGSGEAVAAR